MVVASISFIATSIPLLVEVIIVMIVIVVIVIPILIVLMFQIIMISLLLRLRCFTFTSFPPAIYAVINVIEIFIGELVDSTETDLLQISEVSKSRYSNIKPILTATSSAILNGRKVRLSRN